MLHKYIDEPSAKIKAQHRYREFEMMGSFIFLHINQGEKRAGKYQNKRTAEVNIFM